MEANSMTALTSRTLAALSLILLAISAGCSQTPVADKPSTDKEASAKDSAANNAPAADPMTQELTADSTASEVCQRFMLLLQDGKRLEAEMAIQRSPSLMRLTRQALPKSLRSPATSAPPRRSRTSRGCFATPNRDGGSLA